MEEWKECTLSDIGTIVGGATPSTKDSSNYENGTIAWITPKDLSTHSGRFISHGERNITDKGLKSCSAQIMPEHTILFTSRAPIGYIAIAQNEVCTNQGFKSVIPNKDTDFMFLYYLLKFNKSNIENLGSGTTFKEVSGSTMQKVPVKIPPFSIQKKIATILSSLDDKIELNNKINDNLEQQAQAIFKSWFVDFEPFGGEMPKDWKRTDIYSIANIIYGSPFASKLFNSEKNGTPIIRIRDLKDQHSDIYTPEVRDDAYLIQPKDIVVGMDGEFRPYIWGSEPGLLNQRVCVFENKRPKGKAFLYYSIKPLLDIVEKTQVATTVIHIGKKDFDKFQISLPTKNVLDKFDELTDSVFDKIVNNRLENIRLEKLRDTLLPKLMSGEIDVDSVQL